MYNSNSLVNLVRSCTFPKSFLIGKSIHGHIIKSGPYVDIYSMNHLVAMYLRLNHNDEAHKLFDEMPHRNIFTWVTLISSYAQMGASEMVLGCFRSMVFEGFVPNDFTIVSSLSSCTDMGALKHGKEIHGRVVKNGECSNSIVSNCLVNFYWKCGLFRLAELLFDTCVEPNVVTWGSMISCYCQSGENEEALSLFLRSLRAGVAVNEFVSTSVLGACAALKVSLIGMQVHCLTVKSGVRMDQFIQTALVNVYAKCGELELAYKAFGEVEDPNLFSWTALIGGYLQAGNTTHAVFLFSELLSSGLEPSEQTYATVLGAFAGATGTQVGRQLHSSIIKLGYNAFTFVSNALLDLYTKNNLPEEAYKIYKAMDEHDSVTWNSLIAGFLKSGRYEEAIGAFRNMLSLKYDPTLYTYSSVLSICGDFPAIEWGKQTHCCIVKPGFEFDVVVGSALIDMYAKCGRLDYSRKVFNRLSTKNLISWNTMLTGYAEHGLGNEALEIYNMMQRNGVKPNSITFIGVLLACGHVGLLEDGLYHFNSMTQYGITPETDHMACMVSLFARKGQTERAYNFIMSSPVMPDKVVWRSLLSGCRANKDLDMGKLAAEKILSIDPEDTSALIMLSNIYAGLKMWNETAAIRKMMDKKGLKKDTGYSWIELHNEIYSFTAGQSICIQGCNIFDILIGLTNQLAGAGYVPDSISSWVNVE
ncbi:hypothetical protein LIER_15448 [Lithospermum erythrorhizon]|uniref:Pentatricopeptide repeat-containing protein n=1 Tax=Lithospermum erythrorhizon TaxID=34254 RepID=A0AAV3Q311_LITER